MFHGRKALVCGFGGTMACLWRLRTARYAFLFCYALMERRACAFRVESLHVVPFRAFKHSRSGSNSVTTRGPARQAFRPRSRLYNDRDSQPDKFSFQQRVESVKCFVVGGVSGAVAMSPASALRNFILGNSLAQWEFDTDMGSLEAGLFAIVYRYCVREDDNPQLSSGCVGAFAVVRTLARMDVSESCTTIPLYCGDPFGYFDFSMILQAAVNGVESAALFGATGVAMDYAARKGCISRFPG